MSNDKTLFTYTLVVDYIRNYFYLVNFDAESNDTILFNTEKFYKQPINGYPLNTFAMKITKGSLSFPSVVILDEKLITIDVLNSYQHPKYLKPILMFFADDSYKTKKWVDFYKDYQNKNK